MTNSSMTNSSMTNSWNWSWDWTWGWEWDWDWDLDIDPISKDPLKIKIREQIKIKITERVKIDGKTFSEVEKQSLFSQKEYEHPVKINDKKFAEVEKQSLFSQKEYEHQAQLKCPHENPAKEGHCKTYSKEGHCKTYSKEGHCKTYSKEGHCKTYSNDRSRICSICTSKAYDEFYAGRAKGKRWMDAQIRRALPTREELEPLEEDVKAVLKEKSQNPRSPWNLGLLHGLLDAMRDKASKRNT
uniref:Uncharacterized protein n=1 Tax=Solenopsis bivonae TaxID=2010907 RepID=A0A1Z2R6B7_9ASTR|nr:hypothetical protein So_biv1Pt0118 [Solenopsis bivonae]ASA39255.1 hypothetical protein So_biv1Pt0118 [Solenopsis bivonae]